MDNYKELYERTLSEFKNYKDKTKAIAAIASKEEFYSVIKDIVSPVYNDIKRGADYGVSGCDVILSKITNTLKNRNVIPLGNNIFFQNGTSVMFDENFAQSVSTVKGNPFNKGMVAQVVEDGMYDIESKKTIVHAKVVVYQ